MKLLTSGQAAKFLGIPGRTIRRYLSSGRLQATQHPVTKRWGLTQEALVEFDRVHEAEKTRLEADAARKTREHQIRRAVQSMSDNELSIVEMAVLRIIDERHQNAD